jgi:hypothetical protein
MNIFNIKLDLNKSEFARTEMVTIRQGDVDGTTIAATVYDHGELADLSGVTNAYVEFALPDGEHYYRGEATVDGSVVTAAVDETSAASVPGRACNAYFTLSDGEHEYSTESFVVAILKSATEGMEPPESVDDQIREFVDEWLAEQGLEVTLTVTDGDLDISIT